MKEFKLNAKVREAKGTGASRRLRHQGQVPAIVYGKDKEPMNLLIEHNELFHAVEDQAIFSSNVELNIDGKAETVTIKALQRHPYKPKLLHVDFQRA